MGAGGSLPSPRAALAQSFGVSVQHAKGEVLHSDLGKKLVKPSNLIGGGKALYFRTFVGCVVELNLILEMCLESRGE